jgi:hypothetical protein
MVSVNDKALKEWAVVVKSLEMGEQILLIRKGGITEEEGSFRVREPEFFLFPNHTHQNPAQLQPRAHELLETTEAERPEEGYLCISSYAVVEDIFVVPSLAALARLDDEHPWSADYVAERFLYKRDHPLYGIVLRTYCLPQPFTLPYLASYGGCTSWVTLDEALPTEGAVPVLDDKAFCSRLRKLRAAVDEEPTPPRG